MIKKSNTTKIHEIADVSLIHMVLDALSCYVCFKVKFNVKIKGGSMGDKEGKITPKF